MLALAGLVAVAGTACQSTSTTPLTAAQVVLRAADLPKTLSGCPASGSLDSYAKHQPPGGPVASGWAGLRAGGADQGEVRIYASDPAGCAEELGAARTGTSAANVVVRFSSEDQARAAYASGVLGFSPPPPGQRSPDLTVGGETGLGVNSWTDEPAISGRPSYVGVWQNGPFVSLLVTSGMAGTMSRAIALAVDGRIR